MDDFIGGLSPELFWDVDPSTVDPERNARWLLERVVQRGRWEDWLLLRRRYGKAGIARLAPRLRLDPKAANFLRLYCGEL